MIYIMILYYDTEWIPYSFTMVFTLENTHCSSPSVQFGSFLRAGGSGTQTKASVGRERPWQEAAEIQNPAPADPSPPRHDPWPRMPHRLREAQPSGCVRSALPPQITHFTRAIKSKKTDNESAAEQFAITSAAIGHTQYTL